MGWLGKKKMSQISATNFQASSPKCVNEKIKHLELDLEEKDFEIKELKAEIEELLDGILDMNNAMNDLKIQLAQKSPFKTDSNGNVFQDANELKIEQNQAVDLAQPPKPLLSPNVVGKKENIRVADRIEKDFRVEQKVDEAVRNLILADQTPPPPKFDLMGSSHLSEF